MNFIYFSNTIFRKKDFQSAWIEKDKITITFTEETREDDLIKKCGDEKEAKDLMDKLLNALNQPNR